MNNEMGKIKNVVADYENIIINEIEVNGPNGIIRGYISIPKSIEHEVPCCILSHGTNDSLKQEALIATGLANNGIISVYFNFTGSSEHSLSDGAQEDMTILTEKEDLTSVLNYVSNLHFIDKNNISLYGRSLGGVIAGLVANDHVDKVANLFLVSPAFCIFRDIKNGTMKRNIGNNDKFNSDAAKVRLPDGFPNFEPTFEDDSFLNYNGDTYIFHGLSDNVAPPEDSSFMAELYNAELIFYESETHSFTDGTLGKIIGNMSDVINSNYKKKSK